MNLAKYNPTKPDFSKARFLQPNIKSLDDLPDAYTNWAEESGLIELVKDTPMRIVARDLEELIKQPIPHGNYKNHPRFISEKTAAILKSKGLRVTPVPFPNDNVSGVDEGIAGRYAMIIYMQGCSEFGSGQQQAGLLKMGHRPSIYNHYLKYVAQEEGEHGIQAVGNLIVEYNEDQLGSLLGEDLLARQANHTDTDLQQPLREFNPMVQTLPEFPFYLDKQDRDGGDQLNCQKFSGSAIFAGQMRFFLGQEPRHLTAGEQMIEWMIQAGRIPMDVLAKLEVEWDAISYRLHGNPYNSDSAFTSYQLGIKNPITMAVKSINFKEFRIPHKDAPNGYVAIAVKNMDMHHTNGLTLAVLDQTFKRNNQKRSAMMNDHQRKKLRSFLEDITTYVPEKERRKIIEDALIPTPALSWRPEHVNPHEDDWRSIRGYFTDIFGNPILTEREYNEYRSRVTVSKKDRETLRDVTSTPGWISEEIKPGSQQDIYRSGLTKTKPGDVVLFEFNVGNKATNIRYFTMPQALKAYEKKNKIDKPEKPQEQDSREFLLSIHDDLMK